MWLNTSRLYLLNACLLITHQIDSAYWHEWELFSLPGDIELFLVLNFILLYMVLWGFSEIVQASTKTRLYCIFLASVGILAFLLHAAFMALGHQEFQTPFSCGLLIVILLVSIRQLFDALNTKTKLMEKTYEKH